MENQKNKIIVYKEINDFLQSITSNLSNINPNFCCLKLKANDNNIIKYKSPFKKDFYFLALITNAGESKITYDNTNVTELNSFLVFQSPNLLYSFLRDDKANGFLIYFKKECFSFFKPDFENEFNFFNILQTNFFKLNQDKFKEFAPHFKEVLTAYDTATDNQHIIASIKLLSLLYQLKEFTKNFNLLEESFKTPQHILLQKFIQLINNFYLEKRTVEEYAYLLSVSANHLSKYIKLASDKNALSFINERIINEAKSMITYSNLDISEITFQLNFSDSSNFGKFFKKHTNVSPLEYRKQSTTK